MLGRRQKQLSIPCCEGGFLKAGMNECEQLKIIQIEYCYSQNVCVNYYLSTYLTTINNLLYEILLLRIEFSYLKNKANTKIINILSNYLNFFVVILTETF